MRLISTIIFALCLLPLAMQAQQQPHNTQFMYYKLGYNPGYAGSRETPCITCIYRQQWVGLEGAPNIAALSFTMPLANQRVGIGANLFRHTIGITNVTNLDLAYAYRVRLGNGMLGLGLMTSIRSFSNDYDKTTATQPKDQDLAIPGSSERKFLFNFGTGLYYTSERFYLGVSVPRLLENNIDFASADLTIAREKQHAYLMGGVVLPLSPGLKLQPQALLKYVGKAPFDADLNTNLIIEDRYIAGLTYRLGGNKENGYGESLDLLLAAQLTDHLMFGVSYDFTLSEVKEVATGSIEVSLHYCFGTASAGSEFVNPRFF